MPDNEVEPAEPAEPEPSGDTPPITGEMHLAISEEYQSNFPHPRHLREFENIYPGAARIIFESFEKQGEHRREMEKTILRGSERRASIGQFLGTFLLLVAIIGGIWLGIDGQPILGTSLVTLALATGVLSYVFGDFVPGRKKK